MSAARILLVGILALAMISAIGAAIAMAAHYIAAAIVIFLIGKWLLTKIDSKTDPS